MLSHCTRSVSPPLSEHIENLWMVRGYLATPWRNMILPDGAMELIINLGDAQKLCCPNDWASHTLFRNSWISGERTEPIVIDETGHVQLVGVRFRAGGAWPFLGIPVCELTGRVVELEAILGREIDSLREQLDETPDVDSRFDLMEKWLMQRTCGRVRATPSVNHALYILRRGASEARIGRIADEIGISHKHLLREFDRCVGLRPKLFARLCAFQRAIRLIGQKPSVDWSDTAVACGYYDQPHLIREFRAFSGFTPENYLSKRGPFLNYLEVG